MHILAAIAAAAALGAAALPGPDLDPEAFTMEAVLERVRREGDLYAGVLTTKQRIDRALAALS